MLLQGSPVVNPSDALAISFPDSTPRIRNPEAFNPIQDGESKKAPLPVFPL